MLTWKSSGDGRSKVGVAAGGSTSAPVMLAKAQLWLDSYPK
jgi:hypothetical protein